MAVSKVLISVLLVSLFALHLLVAAESLTISNTVAGRPSKPKYITPKACTSACIVRFSKASRRNRCLRACGTCCQRCLCVPPGTYGNANVCPCYANMTTHGGKRKCP